MSSYHEGKSGVNVKRLVQNIADQYPFEPQIAAVVELVANGLDAKASQISISLNKDDGILEVTDNGLGMSKTQFIEYHDFAATTKERGKGIGFAGQGAKLALNFCKTVVTETWSSNYRGYSEWYLKGNDAPFKIYPGQILSLGGLGTKVKLFLEKASIDFYTEEKIREAVLEHYFPLVDRGLRELSIYKSFYGSRIKMLLNGTEIVTDAPLSKLLEYMKPMQVMSYRRLSGLGIIGRVKNGHTTWPGIMVCTFGKVVERTYFKKEPKEKEKIIGWIEAPYLIEAVTTDKCRFQKGNKIWEGFFRKAQREFTDWLEETGLLEKPVRKDSDFADLEKEINSILKSLPELSFFGTTITRDVAIPDTNGKERELGEGTQKVEGTVGGKTRGEGVSVHPGEESSNAPTTEEGQGVSATPHQRTIRGGIRMTEEERPDLDQESWFDGETVTVNKSHSAYTRARLSGLLNYHILKAVVLSLIEFSMGRDQEPSYQKVFELQKKFFRMWGEQS